MHTDWSSLSLWFFYLWWFRLTFNKKPPIHYLNKLEYFIRPIKKEIVNCWPSGKYVHLLYMYIYCICTQYLVGAPFALITASIRCGMEVISLWHCWGGMEAHVSLIVAFSSSAFFGLLFLIFLLTIPHRGSGLVSLLASQAHQHHGHLTNFWCFWQCGQVPNPAGKWNQHL